MSYQVKGYIRRTDTGQGISGLSVEGWDIDIKFDDFLGKDVTDENGYFEINFSKADYGYFEGGPDIVVKVFNSVGTRIYSSDKIRGAGTSTDFDIKIAPEDLLGEYAVRGTIRDKASGNGLSNLVVEAYDRDLIAHDKLAEAVTNDEGQYELGFNADSFRFWWTFWEGLPDIFIKVKTPEGQVLGTSSTYKPTESGTTINLSVERVEAGEVGLAGPPEEEKRYDVELAWELAKCCRECFNENHPNYFDFGSARGFTKDFDDGMVIAFQSSEGVKEPPSFFLPFDSEPWQDWFEQELDSEFYQDWITTNFNAWKKPVSWLPAIATEGDWWPVVPEAHCGWLEAYDLAREEIIQRVLDRNPSHVYVTGCSLGAALAILAALDLAITIKPQPAITMYNFAGAKVGDKRFATLYNELVPNSCRIRFENDILNDLPPDIFPWIGKAAYTHVGTHIPLSPNPPGFPHHWITPYIDHFSSILNKEVIIPKSVKAAQPTTEAVTYRLNIAIEGQGEAYPGPGTHALISGKQVAISAVSAVLGWRFDHWGGDISDESPIITIVMDGPKNVTAHFERTYVEVRPYIANRDSLEVHRGNCFWVTKMKDSNKMLCSNLDEVAKLIRDRRYNGCYYCLPRYDRDRLTKQQVLTNLEEDLSQHKVIESVVDYAQLDATKRSGVPIDQVRIIRVKSMTWPNTRLGCPEAGMTYQQVLTPGFLIVLEAGDRRFTYHSDEKSRIMLCEQDGPIELL